MGLGLGSTFKKLDIFLTPVPGFNLNGRNHLRTGIGGILSFLILYISVMFAAYKFAHLISRHNPQVNSYVNYNAFTFDDIFNAKDEGFKMAFALERHISGEIIDDSKEDMRYFKWFAQYNKYVDGERHMHEIPMKPCTQADYEEFYPVDPAFRHRIEHIKSFNAFMCLDTSEMDIELRGTEMSGMFNTLDVMVVPCAVKLTLIGGKEDRIPPECEMNREKSMSWFQNFNIVTYYNQGRFLQDLYNEDRITWKSYTTFSQMD